MGRLNPSGAARSLKRRWTLTVFLPAAVCIAAAAAAVALEAVNVVLYFSDPSLFEGAFGKALRAVSLFDRFYNFIYGVFDLSAIVYYLTFSALFVFLTVQVVEKRRWS